MMQKFFVQILNVPRILTLHVASVPAVTAVKRHFHFHCTIAMA